MKHRTIPTGKWKSGESKILLEMDTKVDRIYMTLIEIEDNQEVVVEDGEAELTASAAREVGECLIQMANEMENNDDTRRSRFYLKPSSI